MTRMLTDAFFHEPEGCRDAGLPPADDQHIERGRAVGRLARQNPGGRAG